MKIDNRIWAILTTLVVVALFAGGWFLGAAPLLDQVAVADGQRAEAATHNQQLQAQLNALAKEKEKLPELQDEAALLKMSVPDGVEASAYIRALNDLATAAGVTITAIELQDGQPYQEPVGDASESDAATDDAPSSDGTGTPTPPSGDPRPLTDPLITGQNFVVMPVSVTVSGPWGNVLAFLKGLQSADRLTLVTQVKAALGEGGFEAVIAGTIYVLPDPNRGSRAEADDSSDEAATDPSASPSPSATPDPSTTPTPSPSGTPSAG